MFFKVLINNLHCISYELRKFLIPDLAGQVTADGGDHGSGEWGISKAGSCSELEFYGFKSYVSLTKTVYAFLWAQQTSSHPFSYGAKQEPAQSHQHTFPSPALAGSAQGNRVSPLWCLAKLPDLDKDLKMTGSLIRTGQTKASAWCLSHVHQASLKDWCPVRNVLM